MNTIDESFKRLWPQFEAGVRYLAERDAGLRPRDDEQAEEEQE